VNLQGKGVNASYIRSGALTYRIWYIYYFQYVGSV
jgi:hypothetical protein